jgi:hypothetical protein
LFPILVDNPEARRPNLLIQAGLFGDMFLLIRYFDIAKYQAL